MFIERLNKEEIINYCKDDLKKFQEEIPFLYFNPDEVNKYTLSDGKVTLDISGVSYNISDFDLTNYDKVRHDRSTANIDWIKFMYKKFGEEYKKAFLLNREEQKNKMIEETINKFDSFTVECEKSLEI